jgi:hypothetical protein
MARLRFDTDIGSTLKAAGDLSKAYDKVGTSVKGGVREMNALEKAAKRLTDQNLTPQEKYNQKLELMAKAVKAGKLSMEDAERTAGRLRMKLDEAGNSSRKLFGPESLNSLKSYATGLFSVSAAVALVQSELESVKAAAEKIAQTQLGAAPARDLLKRNIASLPEAERAPFEARANKLAAELRQPQPAIDVALAEAFAASQGNVETTFSRVRTAGQYLPTSPEQIGPFSGTLGDISKVTKSQDDLQNLGVLVKIGAMSRVTDAKALAASVPKALAGATSYGATAEEGGALFAALSVAAADPSGEMTGTGVVAVTQQFEKFFDKQVKDAKFQATAVDTFGERLAALRRDPVLARGFVDTASFEKKVGGPLGQFLLDPNSPIAKEYEKNLGGFGTAAEQRATGQSTIDYLRQGRLSHTAEVERTIAANVEQFQLTQDAALTQEARTKIVRRYAEITGSGERMAGWRTSIHTGDVMTPEEAVRMLEKAYADKPGLRSLDQGLKDSTDKMIEELKALNEKQQAQINQQQTLTAPKPSGRQER